MSFQSTFRKVWHALPIPFPQFSGTRVMMMPVKIGSLAGVPSAYQGLVSELYGMTEWRFSDDTGYLTIDEKSLEAGQTLRRAGRHVDGFYHGRSGGWGGGGGWGSVGNGMLTVSSTPHCRAYLGNFEGAPGPEGDCEHLDLNSEGHVFEAAQVYWVDGACVHESMPVERDTDRQFVRLSMPSNGPWFANYTPNPEGIMPRASAEILDARQLGTDQHAIAPSRNGAR